MWTDFVNRLQKYYFFLGSARGKEKNYYDDAYNPRKRRKNSTLRGG